jgi:hypothetical protein
VTALAFILAVTLAAAIVEIVWLAHRLVTGAERLADTRVHESEIAGDLRVANADTKTQADRADNEQRRADALETLLDDMALDGDAAGARARVLARYARARATAGARPSPVPADPDADTVSVVGRDDLIRPGD